MHRLRLWKVLIFILLAGLWLGSGLPAQAGEAGQQPTVSVPTVTSSPSGPMVSVRLGGEEQINVRAGPSRDYEKVGVLVIGQQAPALGRTPGGDWILLTYPGAPGGVAWVYQPLVDVFGGELPIVEPPPTVTPRVTPTIDPTLAAQFVVELPATRPPTFTPPPPLAIPTYSVASTRRAAGGVPIGMVIIGLGVIGIFGTLISLLRGR